MFNNWIPFEVVPANSIEQSSSPDLFYVILKDNNKPYVMFEGYKEECENECITMNSKIKNSLLIHLEKKEPRKVMQKCKICGVGDVQETYIYDQFIKIIGCNKCNNCHTR